MAPIAQPSFRPLASHEDERGTLTEVFRNEWAGAQLPVQWNFVRSRPNSLRGVHVHVRHVDHLLVLRGTMLLGLCDLREGTSTFMKSQLLELNGNKLTLASLPTGVAHGFYFPEATDFIYCVTHYWDPVTDELGCAWNDPELALNWPCDQPILSERDRDAPSLATLLDTLRGNTVKSW